MSPPRSAWMRYGIAVLAVLVALVIKLLLSSVLDRETPFLLFFGTVAVSAWFGGLGPGLLATVLAALCSVFFFLSPTFSFMLDDAQQVIRLMAFTLECLLIIILSELRLRGQARLAEERERYAVTLASIGDAVIATDDQGRITFMNRVAESLTGWDEQQAAGRHLSEVFQIVNEQTRQVVENPVVRVIREGVIVGLANHTMLIGRDGVERPIDDSGAPIRSREGAILGAVLVFRDVSSSRAVAQALFESEVRFRTLADTAPVLIWISDTTRQRVFFNQVWLNFTGRTMAQELGYGWAEGVHPEDYQRWLDTYNRAFDTRETFIMEYRLRRYDGTYRWMLVNGVPQFHAEVFTGYIGSCIDITERKEAEDGLRVLASASTLLSTSLDYQSTLSGVVRLAVPTLADLCAIDILDDDKISTLAVAYIDAAREPALVPQINQRYKLNPDSTLPLQRVLHSGQAEIMADIPEDFLLAIAQNDDHRAALRAVGQSSGLIVPLLARGRILGAISFVSSQRRRHYMPSDLPLAEELARRAALAMDNARLYAAEQQARKLAERAAERTARLQSVTAALSQALTPQQVAEVVVRQGAEVLGAAAGVIVLPDETGQSLSPAYALGYPEAVLNPWRQFPTGTDVPLAEAFRSGSLICIESPAVMTEQYPQIITSTYPASASIPLLVEGRPVGVMGLSFEEPRDFNADDRAFMLALGQQCAQALERSRLYEAERRAHAAAEAAHRRLAFLAEASAVLTSSLDYETTLASIARMTMPTLADWSTIHIVEDGGTIRQLAVAHPNPVMARMLWELERRYPLDPNLQCGLPHVIRTGRPELIPRVDDALLQSYSQDDEKLQMLRQLDIGSSIIMPLISRGRRIGAISLMVSKARRSYGADDLALAEELGRRAAVAVDNARLYQEAQQAVMARDQFLSIASHELKTPLTSLMGYAELLERRLVRTGLLGERDQRALRVIVEQAVRLNRLVGALLDLSRIQTGQLNIERTPFDLSALARRLVEEIQPSLDQHTLTYEGDDQPLIVEGDELRLEQVFQNLIQNAVKYSPRGGPITLQLERRGQQACVAVIDRGIGIPAESLPQLFRRFYRARNVDPHHISGMGVGLFVVKEIISLHGGSIDVTSREGQGSTFTVCLPLGGSE